MYVMINYIPLAGGSVGGCSVHYSRTYISISFMRALVWFLPKLALYKQ